MKIPTKNEQLELVKRYQAGDNSALEDILASQEGTVFQIVKSRVGYGVDKFDDALQCGRLGVIYAAQQFDFSYGTAFSTYCYFKIKSEVWRFLNNDTIIHVPYKQRNSLYTNNKRTNYLDNAKRVLKVLSYSDLLHNGVMDQTKIDLGTLSERECFIVEKRIYDNCTLKEVGVMLGITKERVRQIYKESLRKLRGQYVVSQTDG